METKALFVFREHPQKFMYDVIGMMSAPESSALQDNNLLWYCIKSRPKQEHLTARSLRTDVQIEVFCPSIRFQRPRGTGKMWVTEALFPGYLFARFQHFDTSRHVRATRGVSQIVGFGGVPSVLPDAIIMDLREFVTEEDTVTIQPHISAGEEVNVINGIFCGIRAVVTRVLPARQRITILLELLGGVREVEVSITDVLPNISHPLTR